jgi:hypothetical protein
MKLDTVTVTAPSAWASYLINGDDSGISKSERSDADDMVATIGCGAPVDCEDTGFDWCPDYGEPGDCKMYTFLEVVQS